jgi:hypothetical protein
MFSFPLSLKRLRKTASGGLEAITVRSILEGLRVRLIRWQLDADRSPSIGVSSLAFLNTNDLNPSFWLASPPSLGLCYLFPTVSQQGRLLRVDMCGMVIHPLS